MSNFESQATKEAKAKIKKGNKEVKTSKKPIIITVIVTLLSVAAIAGLIYAGFILGQSYEKGINADVASQVKELATVVSKPSQQ